MAASALYCSKSSAAAAAGAFAFIFAFVCVFLAVERFVHRVHTSRFQEPSFVSRRRRRQI